MASCGMVENWQGCADTGGAPVALVLTMIAGWAGDINENI